MKVDVLNLEGKPTGQQVELPDHIFGIEPNEHAVYLDVKQFLANQRQGTHETKGRSQISGSTRKLHKQKGTGGSRKGDIKNPMYRGGGRMFGPHPRDYGFKLNRKLKVLARCSALSAKAAGNNIVVVDSLALPAIKTKSVVTIINALGATNKRVLFVTNEYNQNFYLSARNISRSSISTATSLNTYSIINAGKLVLDRQSIEVISETLAK